MIAFAMPNLSILHPTRLAGLAGSAQYSDTLVGMIVSLTSARARLEWRTTSYRPYYQS